MVATSRSTVHEDGSTDPATLASETDRATQILHHAMQSFSLAREERLRTEALRVEIADERASMDEAILRLRFDERTEVKYSGLATTVRSKSVLGSLQFVAGCALAGAVVTGIVLGHDIHGVDPTYFGALAGLMAGFRMWAVRGL